MLNDIQLCLKLDKIDESPYTISIVNKERELSMFICSNLQSVYEKLDELVPFDGPVVNVNKNKKLEKFRKATNVVYDIFNNGLMNKGKSLKVLGLMKYDLPLPEYHHGHYYEGNWDRIKEIVTPIFEKIIFDAVQEQGIELELIPNAQTGQIEVFAK